MAAHIEITAIFRNQKFRWDDTVLVECELPVVKAAATNGHASDIDPFHPSSFDNFSSYVTIKTEADEGELKPGVEYRFLGSYQNYTNPRTRQTEKQFVAKSFTRSTPHGREGIIRYLVDAPWIGHAFARKLWDAYGGDAVRMMREETSTAAASVGLIPARAAEAAAWLEKEKRIEDCKIALTDLLGSKGFPKATTRLAIKVWGNAAADVIRKNPYRLMLFRGCGFAKTDKLYLELKHNPAAIKRQALCAWYGLASESEGHTWVSEGSFVQGLRDRISSVDCNPKLAFRFGRRAPLGSPLLAGRRDDNGRYWFAEGSKARNEGTVAKRVAAMLADSKVTGSPTSDSLLWPEVSGIDASDHQKEQLANALKSQLGVFIGTPGTGKTRTAAQLVALLIDNFGDDMVAVCAPTGKAAVRITEAMNEYGVPIKARTIHSLLVVASHADGDGWGFEHNENCPLPYQFVVCDESSMIDTNLMASLLRACADGTHVLFIGDTNQLPPVGHGAPLRDFTAAGVPCGELTEIWRNAGSIVKACQSIRFGKRFEVDKDIDLSTGKNLKLLESKGGESSAKRIVAAVRNIKAAKLVDPIWDVQVIVAVNEKSPLSRKAMNKLLQDELNPHGMGCSGSPFRVGDKIICLKNGLMPLDRMAGLGSNGQQISQGESDDDSGPFETDNKNDPGKAFIANGELGCVLKVEPKRTIAEFQNPPRIIVIPRGGKDSEEPDKKESASREGSGDTDKGSGCNFDLGYAISCHKSQGSEWPIVIIALDECPGAFRVCSREWIYTGISRAKKICFLVGRMWTAVEICKSEKLSKRKTFLVERIREEMGSIQLAVSLASQPITKVLPVAEAEMTDIQLPTPAMPMIEVESRA